MSKEAHSRIEPLGLDPILRVSEILDRLAVSRSWLEQMLRDERIPQLGQLSPRVRGLHESQLDAWIASRIAERSRMASIRHPARLPVWSRDLAPRHYPRGLRLLRRREVLARVRFSKTTLYRMIDRHAFHAPVPIGIEARRWIESEVVEWLAQCLPRAA